MTVALDINRSLAEQLFEIAVPNGTLTMEEIEEIAAENDAVVAVWGDRPDIARMIPIKGTEALRRCIEDGDGVDISAIRRRSSAEATLLARQFSEMGVS